MLKFIFFILLYCLTFPNQRQLFLQSLEANKSVWVCAYFIIKCFEHQYPCCDDRLYGQREDNIKYTSLS